ncbi:DUF4214 domain-containing protein [Methylobacterium sp. NFXW15]|uniref:DUF4214 domain-containing protein n=1 Tax=Methylobacterium sp. NFXW15 TaxID=2819512 RepID=UPI003CF2A3E1
MNIPSPKDANPLNLVGLLALTPGDFINECYHLLLGRPVEPEARRYSEVDIHLGRGRFSRIVSIYFSKEAENYRKRIFVTSEDRDFVNNLYLFYLGRTADPEGLDHYLSQLERRNRKKVMAAFMRSAEARAVGTLWYEVEWLITRLRRDRWPWRWAARRKRLHHVEYEAILSNAYRPFRLAAGPETVAQSPGFASSQGASSALAVTGRPAGLELLAESELGANSARILRRMRALAGHQA